MKIFILGVAGYNIGDDAIAYVVARHLRIDNSVKVGVINNGRLSKYGIEEVLISRTSIRGVWAILRAIFWSDVVLIGGGTIIQDKLGISYIRGMIPFFLQVVIVAKALGKSVLSVPIGVDRLHTNLGKKLYMYIDKCVDIIFYRDSLSFDYSEKVLQRKLDVNNVYYDPAILLKSSELNVCNYAVLSLVGESISIDILKILIDKFLNLCDRLEVEPKLLVMDSRPDEELRVYNFVKANVEVINTEDLFSTVDLIRNSKFVLSMRLHSLILGLGYTKLLCISRSEKNVYYSRLNNIKDISINDISNYSIDNLVSIINGLSINKKELDKGVFEAEQYLIRLGEELNGVKK